MLDEDDQIFDNQLHGTAEPWRRGICLESPLPLVVIGARRYRWVTWAGRKPGG